MVGGLVLVGVVLQRLVQLGLLAVAMPCTGAMAALSCANMLI